MLNELSSQKGQKGNLKCTRNV